jgi:imidazolonepropionase-like amidohydrolase
LRLKDHSVKIHTEILAFCDKQLRSNPRFTGDKTAELIIREASLFDGDAWHDGPVDILIREGVIQDIGHNIRATGESVAEVFAHHRPVTPGLVDIHSHSGVDSLPYSDGLYDLFELSADLTPYVRAIDAIYTGDGML